MIKKMKHPARCHVRKKHPARCQKNQYSYLKLTSLFGFTAYLHPVDGKPVNAVVEGGESEGPRTNLIIGTLLQVPEVHGGFSFY